MQRRRFLLRSNSRVLRRPSSSRYGSTRRPMSGTSSRSLFFAGAVAVMDVRLLGGLAATSPAFLLARARSFAVAALAGMAVTGCVLFSAEASHIALNPAFQLKAALVAAGLINVA